jgi:hypothetical protein
MDWSYGLAILQLREGRRRRIASIAFHCFCRPAFPSTFQFLPLQTHCRSIADGPAKKSAMSADQRALWVRFGARRDASTANMNQERQHAF